MVPRAASSNAKSRRTSRACDFCHKRGRRCKKDTESPLQCTTCIDFGVACTWSRVPAKRGTKPRSGNKAAPWTLSETKHGSIELIEQLIDNFFEAVYPVAITIHEQTFRDRWNTGKMPDSRGSYARLMAMCAVSALRIKNGAVLKERSVPNDLNPRLYFDETLQALPDNVNEFEEFESLQATGLACLTALHYSDGPLLHQILGLYHAVVAEQGFGDEKRWPRGLSEIDAEERRRLFWHMYRLEVHTSLVIGHVVRCPELQSSVAYPTIQDIDSMDPEDRSDSEWLSGWNFVTDLYRGIEHVIAQFKYRRASVNLDRRRLSTSFVLDYDPQKKILDPLAAAREDLPDRFKKAMPVSYNTRRNRCGYQTANIACTYQLLRMVTFSAYHTTTLYEACQTVLELIDEISNIPIEYLRAMGLAMLQELSGFGHILSSFINEGLSKSDYYHLRTVMLCMSELLEILSSCMASATEAGQRLRAYVEDIDRLLDIPQTPDRQTPTEEDDGQSQAVDNTLDLLSPDLLVPLDILQRIPWPAAWEESVGLF